MASSSSCWASAATWETTAIRLPSSDSRWIFSVQRAKALERLASASSALSPLVARSTRRATTFRNSLSACCASDGNCCHCCQEESLLSEAARADTCSARERMVSREPNEPLPWGRDASISKLVSSASRRACPSSLEISAMSVSALGLPSFTGVSGLGMISSLASCRKTSRKTSRNRSLARSGQT